MIQSNMINAYMDVSVIRLFELKIKMNKHYLDNPRKFQPLLVFKKFEILGD